MADDAESFFFGANTATPTVTAPPYLAPPLDDAASFFFGDPGVADSQAQEQMLESLASNFIPTGGDVGVGVGASMLPQLVSSALPPTIKYPLKIGASILGAYGGRPTGQYVRDVGAEIVSGTPENIPSIPLPERNLTQAILEGPLNLAMGGAMSRLGSKQVGQQTINEAKNKFVNAVGATSRDLVSKSYDDVANEMVPDIAQSVVTAMDAGAFKGASGSKAQGIIETNVRKLIKGVKGETKGLEEEVGDLLIRKSKEQGVDSNVIREYLDQKIKEPGGILEYIGRNYKDPTSQEAADKAITAFIDRFKDLDNPLNDLVDLNGLKRSYQRLVNYDENLAPYDKIQNTVNRKIAQFVKESIEELSGGDDLVKNLNNKLGALYDVEDMISGATAKDSIIKQLSAATQYSELFSSLPGGLGLASVMASGAAAGGAGLGRTGAVFATASAPAIFHTISKYMRSPSGLIKRGIAQDKLGRISRGIGDWYENKDLFQQILLDVTKDTANAFAVRNALDGDSGNWAAKQVNGLVQQFPELESVFETTTGIFAGLKSYFHPYIVDAQEQAEYANRLSNIENSKPFLERDSEALAEKLSALNRDGSVIGISPSQGVPKQAPNAVSGIPDNAEALPDKEPPEFKSTVTGLADGVRITRQPYSY